MRLRAYDTVHVSSVQAENIRPGQEFEIGDAAGEDLLKAHPGLFAVLSRSTETKAEGEPQNKAEPAPENKAAAPVSSRDTATSTRRVPRH